MLFAGRVELFAGRGELYAQLNPHIITKATTRDIGRREDEDFIVCCQGFNANVSRFPLPHLWLVDDGGTLARDTRHDLDNKAIF